MLYQHDGAFLRVSMDKNYALQACASERLTGTLGLMD